MADRDRNPAASAAKMEGIQPDPMLKASTGRIHPAWMSALGLIIVVILAVVFYGLNEPVTSSEQTASSAPATAPAAKAQPPNPTPQPPPQGNPAPAKSGNG